jgi:phosphoglycerate kinase
MNKKTIRDIDLANKRVLVRVDYNVPVKDGVVGDTLRIKESFATLNYLLGQGCSLVLMSHLGEPKGTVDLKYSLRPVAEKAGELLGKPITFFDDCVGEQVEQAAANLKPGEIMMLENVRFHPEELANDAAFAQQLARLGEIYVNDAFAVDHRDQVSVSGIAPYLPAVAGLLVEKEVDTITQALENPKRPLLGIIGGVKVSSKIKVLNNFLDRVNALLIGGAMANTFLAAQGHAVGKSTYEPNELETAKQLIEAAHTKSVKLMLPVDVVVTDELADGHVGRTVDVASVRANDIIADVGAQTLETAFAEFGSGGTAIWNGPFGVTEIPAFAAGSRMLATELIDSGLTTIIGGGDTAAFVDAEGLHDKFSFVSTGGGASLALMSGEKLPGIDALLSK